MTQDAAKVAEIAGRSADNCSFYPACYITGDCPERGWETANCGLPKDEQRRLSLEWRAKLSLECSRNDLATRLRREVMAGKHDHLLQDPTP
jgi:hypothetical protein